MTDKSYIPRLPTEQEREALARHVAEERCMYLPEDDDYREAESAVAGAAICVFEGYVPDCPGTTGSIMLVVWPMAVSYFEAFLMRAGELETIAQAEEVQLER